MAFFRITENNKEWFFSYTYIYTDIIIIKVLGIKVYILKLTVCKYVKRGKYFRISLLHSKV